MNDPHARYEFGDFILDVGRQRLVPRSGGEGVPLNGKGFEALLYFVERAGEPLEKSALLRDLWPGVVVEENSLVQTVSALRDLLGERRGENRYIATLPRRGYRFVADVRRIAAEAIPVTEAAPPTSVSSASRRPRALLVGVVAALVVAAVAVWVTFGVPRETAAGSIAILPFKPLMVAERNEALELGMTDALIERLARDPQRAVRPLSSVREFSAVDQDPLAAGRALGVDAVLDGQLQRDGDRLRVSVRLLRTSDGRQMWSQVFERPFTSVFEMQDSIVAQIADSLSWPAVTADGAHPDTRDPEAFALFASGRYAFLRLTEASLVQSIDFFEKALTRDPSYARAYAGIADSCVLLAVLGARAPEDVYPRARVAAEKALSLDPQLSAAHVSLGQILMVHERDLAGAEREIRRAIAIDPQSGGAYFYLGTLSTSRGDLPAALAAIDQAIRLQPHVLANRASRGLSLMYAGRLEESENELSEILALDDRFDLARGFLMRVWMAQGRYSDVLDHMRGRELRGPGSFAFAAQALALSGREQEARAELERILKLASHRHVPAYDIATIYAALHDADNAFLWLDRAIDDSSPIGGLEFDPAFAGLREDVRFAALVARSRTPRA